MYFSEIEAFYSDVIAAAQGAGRKRRPAAAPAFEQISAGSAGGSSVVGEAGILDMLFTLESSLYISLGQAMLQGRPWRRVLRVLSPPELAADDPLDTDTVLNNDLPREFGDGQTAGIGGGGCNGAAAMQRSGTGSVGGSFVSDGFDGRQLIPFETIAEGNESGDRSTAAVGSIRGTHPRRGSHILGEFRVTGKIQVSARSILY